ncbi:S-layer homology domain-containing protein [Lysinibacillus endophyticus]|uniref:S-layer homology domain-containing protein n=1 Tax=Ureibacillus endophyticus TaxID=1978490 RepID=UPI003134D26A
MKKIITASLSISLLASSFSPVLAAENDLLNDSLTNLVPLVLKELNGVQKASVANTLDSANESDFFKLVLDKDQLVDLKVSGLKNEEVWFTLSSKDGEQILNFDEPVGDTLAQKVSLAKGEYIIRLYLRYSHQVSNYKFDVQLQDKGEFFEVEPNNTFETANYLPLNTSMIGHANVNQESDNTYPTWQPDYYKFEVPVTQKYGIKYTSETIARVYLYDEARTLLNSNAENKTFNLTPGTYYVKVEHYTSEERDYTIEVDTLKFSDVTLNTSGVKEIAFLSNLGIIGGYDDGTFRPNDYVKKGQAASMVVKALGLSTKNRPTTSYKDISKHWANDAIKTLVDEGILPDGKKFDPNANLTRGEMASIIVNAYKLKGVSSTVFSDVPKSSTAYPYVSALAANNITTGYGDGTFKPKNPLTRAHFSIFLSRAMDDRYKQ